MSIADRIIQKCGGVKTTAELVGCSQNWVYRWRLPRNQGGTGGKVPGPAMSKLVEAGQAGLCEVTPADFFSQSPK